MQFWVSFGILIYSYMYGNIFGIVLGKDEPRRMQVCIHTHAHTHTRVCVEEPECCLDFVMTEMICECPSLPLQHTRGA